MVLIFAGTTEGRRICEFFSKCGIPALACTATDYGGQLLERDNIPNVRILPRRLDEPAMEELIRSENISTVIDATHPYADIVSKNIDKACGNTNTACVRVLRDKIDQDASQSQDGIVYVDTVAEAVDFLQGRTGTILAATGVKDLKEYTRLPDYQERVYARILSSVASVKAAAELGFEGKNLICMQGPFSEELNEALIHMTGAAFLVTKQSGAVGGFPEKLHAAKKTGITMVIVRRPSEIEEEVSSNGADYPRYVLTEDETYRFLEQELHITARRQVTLAGIGMGSGNSMTEEVRKIITQADLLIGAGRMVRAALSISEKPYLTEYRADRIRRYLEEHPQYFKVAVLLSGDSSFFSGAQGLRKALPDYDVRILPGISSVSYLAAKLGVSREDACVLSVHGRDANVISQVRRSRKTFLLTSGGDQVSGICRKLIDYGLGQVRISVGERLSYPDEEVYEGSPDQVLQDPPAGDLVTLLIENDHPDALVSAGLADSFFERGSAGGRIVPMTKSEVRALVLSKLKLQKDSIVWDIGAGTGSVAIECARLCSEGRVYAIEKKPEAAELIRRNAIRLQADNLIPVTGTAPQVLDSGRAAAENEKAAGAEPETGPGNRLPEDPTHAFLGGTSGNLQEILCLLHRRNPDVRIVITAVALETLFKAKEGLEHLGYSDPEIVSVTVARAEKTGPYSMMKGQNPVWILSAGGK